MNQEIYSVDEIKKRFESVARKYEINEAYLFGSYARGEATIQSDVDIYMKEGKKIRTLFQLSGFRLEVKDVLEKDVDIVLENNSNPKLENDIRKDLLKIYG